uniref:FXYD domain-containing ion transport regulator n=1 Tax=Xiphophorus maculatus TaxID=8083 RepID=A0A3B5RA50_XIPMA
MATAESVFPDQSDFHYDYETLRTTGVILAVVMFVSGILIALSKKFTKCFKSSSNSSTSGTQIPKTEGELLCLSRTAYSHVVLKCNSKSSFTVILSHISFSVAVPPPAV